ncbi:hypothetical protein DEO72_LG6g1622 [Vigna unguiculata]|uniref:Uncharacterized protein n=1 Tax=Vigna unguiculata TaxID=3917 RepID=A0A4D6M6H3_VIGUN|nr:hypothetical protein DEO72_LG6g1622 [Vigna unguiculata]
MLALVLDTSTHPRAMCYKCYNESIFPHHKGPWDYVPTTMPTPYSRTQQMELRLISLPCHIDTNPFMSLVELMPNSSFKFHDSSHTIIMLNIHSPTKSRKQSHHAVSRPVSPNTSLRLQGLAQARRTLAQASSLRLGESSTFSIRTLHAFSLRPNPPRLSETFARSKVQRVVWATVRGEMLRRAPVNLALTRQARLGEFNRPRHWPTVGFLGVNRERQQLLERFSELETKEQKDMKPLSTTLVGTRSNFAKQERERQQLLERFSELETKEQKDMKPLSTTLVGTRSNFAKQERSARFLNYTGKMPDFRVGKLHLDSMLERVWCSLASTCFRVPWVVQLHGDLRRLRVTLNGMI